MLFRSQYAESRMREDTQARERKSVDDAVNFVKSDDSLKPYPTKVVQGYLQMRYSEDTGFKAAYDNRGKDPKAWEGALKGAQSSFKDEMKGFAPQNLRSDVEAAKASVSGARGSEADTSKIDPGKLRKMSDVEFRSEERRVGKECRL